MQSAGERRRALWLEASSSALSATAAIAGLMVLAAHLVGRPALAAVVPGAPPAHPAVGIAILAAAGALEAWRLRLELDAGVGPLRWTTLRRVAQPLLAAVALGIGAARLLGEPWAGASAADTGTASLVGVGLVALGAGLVLTPLPNRAARHAGEVLLVAAVAVAHLALTRSLVELAAGELPTGAPLAGAYGVLALGLAALGADAEGGLLRVLGLDGDGGSLARRLYPLALLAPPTVAVVAAAVAPTAGHTVLAPVATILSGLAAAGVWTSSTRLERVERERLAGEARYRSVIDTAGDAIVTTDAEGRILLANRATQLIFERNLDELLGQEWTVLLGARHHDGQRANMAAARAAADPRRHAQNIQIAGRHRDGSEFPVELSIVPWRTKEGALYFTAILRDASRRQMIEDALRGAKKEAETAAKAKADFLATMSHEIRTPMNAIIGMTQLLMETHLDGEQLDYANTIRNSGEHLMTIINDILDYSKIESGKLELEQVPVDVRRLAEECLDLVGVRASEKSLDLAYYLDNSTPPAVVGDPARLRQIILNLLNNAVKFTAQGQVEVHVHARRRPDPQLPWEVQFSVRDTGIGIPSDRFDRLFQMFSQVDASTTRAFGGTGLGLAISKRLTEAMGGRIWVESEIGKGSTFHFTIVTREAPMPERPAARHRVDAVSGRRVLVVDDNATNRKVFRLQLERWGMRVRDAESGATALEWLRAGEGFDLAIVDHQMPGMDGIMLVRQMRELPSATALPIIVASSLGNRPPEYNAPDVRIQAFLNKPIKQSQLLDAILNAVGLPQQAREARAEPTPTPTTVSSLRILLAEDNLVNQKVAVRMLERLGYRAELAQNGEEALEAVKAKDFDVVLMDIQMPRMDGIQATKAIRALEKGKAIRIVAMTADAMPGDKERFLAAGMDDYIAKPVRMEVLSAALGLAGPPADPKVPA